MVESVTVNYGWTKPEVTKSASTWGGFLNGDLDSIDALVFANQQGVVPIGGIQMFGGAAAPANWLLCDGASYSVAAPYDKLFAVLSTRFGGSGGSFNVPNLAQKFPLGAGPNPVGQAGGGFSVPIATANLPAHAHPIVDVAHNHGVNQWTHNHGDVGHTHPDAGSYQDAHSHTYVRTDTGHPGIASGGAFAGAFVDNTSGQQPALHIGIGTGYANIDSRTSNISLVANGTNLSTTQNTGSGTPLSVVPPFVAVYFIVRYQ